MRTDTHVHAVTHTFTHTHTCKHVLGRTDVPVHMRMRMQTHMNKCASYALLCAYAGTSLKSYFKDSCAFEAVSLAELVELWSAAKEQDSKRQCTTCTGCGCLECSKPA